MNVGGDDDQLNDVGTPLRLGETVVNAGGLFLKVCTPLVSGKLGAPLTERMLKEREPQEEVCQILPRVQV